MGLDASLLNTDPASFVTKAVNLPASDGEITKIELLSTPNAAVNGVPNTPLILDTWPISNSLNITENTIVKDVKIYQTNAHTLKIMGFKIREKVTLKMVSVTGKEVFVSNFYTDGINEVAIPNVSKGFYFVQIVSKKNNFTQKILIN